MGCQLAFVQVAVLYWGIGRWLDRGEIDPMERLIDASRSPTVRLLRGIGRKILLAYAVTWILGFVSMPLVAARNHLITPAGFLIGPPVILLTSIALISGFLMLLTAPIGGIVVAPFTAITRWSLAGCDGLVELGDRMPLGHIYVPDIPVWWLWGFYLILLAALWCRPLWSRPALARLERRHWLLVGLAGSAIKALPRRTAAHLPRRRPWRLRGDRSTRWPRAALRRGATASGPDAVRRCDRPVSLESRHHANRRVVSLARRPGPF